MATKNTEVKKAMSTKGDKLVTSPRKAVAPLQDERKKGDGDRRKKNDEKGTKKAQAHSKKEDKPKTESEQLNFEEGHHQIKEKILFLKLKLQEIQSELSEASEEKDDTLLQLLSSFIDVSSYLPPGGTPEATHPERTAAGSVSCSPVGLFTEKEAPKEIKVSPTFSPYPHPVFGVPLKTLVTDSAPQHYFWRVCVHHLLSQSALEAEGVWRVPGEAEEIQYYKKCFDEGKEVTFKCSYFDVAGLFKQWIRELPEPLIPPLFDAQVPFLLDAHKGEDDSVGLLNDLRDLVQSLPKPNFAVVCLLGGLLAELAKHSDVNKMTEDNIIRCILPTVGCVPALFLWMIRCPEMIFGGTLVQEHRKNSNASASSQIL